MPETHFALLQINMPHTHAAGSDSFLAQDVSMLCNCETLSFSVLTNHSQCNDQTTGSIWSSHTQGCDYISHIGDPADEHLQQQPSTSLRCGEMLISLPKCNQDHLDLYALLKCCTELSGCTGSYPNRVPRGVHNATVPPTAGAHGKLKQDGSAFSQMLLNNPG